MKKIKYSFVICMIAVCMLSACGSPKNAVFNGSKTGNEDYFDMSFDILNTTYTHTFEMKQGENLLVHIEKSAGDVHVKIQEGDEEPVYEGNGDIASDFSVQIPKDGSYTVSVSGKDAAGHVTFNRNNSSNNNADKNSTNENIYGSVIGSLEDSGAYAILKMNYSYDVLMTTDEIYDEGSEKQAAIYADVYYTKGNQAIKLGTIMSSGTAYPLRFTENAIYTAEGHGVSKYVLSEKDSELVLDSLVYEIFDESGNVTYKCEKDGIEKESTESEFKEMFDEYDKAQIIHFSYGADGCINE